MDATKKDIEQFGRRTGELRESAHVKEQSERVHETLSFTAGIRSAPTLDTVINTIAQSIAVLEINHDCDHVISGGILVIRGPMEGYGIFAYASDVYISHIDPTLKTYPEMAAALRAGREAEENRRSSSV